MTKQKKQTPSSERLSPADRLIIESYKNVMEGLAAYFGEAFEFVLHDLSDYDHSIVKIVNGAHSGRQEGAPLTDFALSMLEAIQKNGEGKPFISYSSKSKYGKPVRSTTIVVFGENQKAIGLLCINLYLDSPLSALLANFSPGSAADYITENFSSDSDELVKYSLERAVKDAQANTAIPGHLKNKEIVTLLYHQGIFNLKNAVQLVSEDLGISKNTVYLHIRSLEEK